MFELLRLLIALIGTGIASWQDLKKGEVRNLIPAAMIASALLLHGAEFFLSGNITNLAGALLIILAFAAIGLILSYFNFLHLVGGADFALFAGVVSLMPEFNPANYFVRVIIVGALFFWYQKLFYPENIKNNEIRFCPTFFLAILVLLII